MAVCVVAEANKPSLEKSDSAKSYQKGGGGAIDLVMYVNGCQFNEAVAWLRDRFASGLEECLKHLLTTPGCKPLRLPKQNQHHSAYHLLLTQVSGP
ncbi:MULTISPECIES: hypothetical protein [Nostocales]|uniref:Uncharacterized protein n=3 Tax=Nostocales TaxID=1161 RepID=A0A8S9TCC4_9CYAN|nr:hypothetical protein [Tolypothrix bouteillei]KAF3889826.1 hypothetical protein DA73_0400033425 [Tolypothrix bouteillei VB521301]